MRLFNLYPLIVILLISGLFSSCKKTPEITDERDEITGNYSCIDSMFEVESIEEIDGYIKVNYRLKKVLFHPLIAVSKGTFFTDNKEWVKGVRFQTIQKESSDYDNSEMGMVKNKVFRTYIHSGSLALEDLDSPSERIAAIYNNEISVVYKTSFSYLYSRSRLKRLP